MLTLLLLVACFGHLCSSLGPCPQSPVLSDLPSPLPPSIQAGLTAWDKFITGLNTPFPYGIGVSVAYKGKTLATRSYGQLFPTPDTYFRIGSVTKLFVAITAFQLSEGPQPKIHLDSPLSDYFSTLKFSFDALSTDTRHRQPTIRELLAQMSGLPRGIPCDLPGNCSLSNKQMLPRLQELFLYFPPGVRPSYSNLGFAILGNFLAEYAGYSSWEDYLQEKILDPLQMKDSGLNYTSEVLQNLAGWNNTYTLWGDGWGAPAGSMYSTLHDMTKVGTALLSNCKNMFKYQETCDEFLQTAYVTPDYSYYQGLPFEDNPLPVIGGLVISKSGSIPIDSTNLIRAVTGFQLIRGYDFTWNTFLVGNLNDLEKYGISTSLISSGINTLLDNLVKYQNGLANPYPLPAARIQQQLVGQYEDPSGLVRCVKVFGNQLNVGPKGRGYVPFEYRRTRNNGNILTVVPQYDPSASCELAILLAVDNVVVEYIVENGTVTGYKQPGQIYGHTYKKFNDTICQ